MYACDVLADSVGPHGIRLTTLEVTFPRPYLAEFNTHRVLSRNSASSRAIPTELQIERVKENPYIPAFRKRVKGMGGGEFLAGMEYKAARLAWLTARDHAVISAQCLLETAKDDASRLLEPFMWQTVIVSATEWENFLNLRDHEAAALPMQTTAQMMRKALEESVPKQIGYGGWHLPLIDYMETATNDLDGRFMASVSAGRCARSSYLTQHNPEDMHESKTRWDSLAKNGHWSPSEHPAQCVDTKTYIGNFRGWKQLRKFYPDEAVFLGRLPMN